MGKLWSAVTGRILKRSFRFFESLGVHVIPVHFYSPIPDTRALRRDTSIFDRKSQLLGIEMDEEKQVALLTEICPKHRSEYEQLPVDPTGDPTEYYLSNGSFGFVSGQMHYCMVRHFKPNNIIEIGSGFSTLITLKAARANDAEHGSNTKLTAIEPYPEDSLSQLKDESFSLVKSKVEDVDLDIVLELGDGDLLFIDSSHVSKIGSDVNFELFEVLPRLAKGVIVHIHDIQFPYDYFKSYILDERLFWNEQYLVQAFLMYNHSFEVLWCASYMAAEHPDLLAKHFPHYDPSRIPTSLYIRRIT
jgi:hypothetical protein